MCNTRHNSCEVFILHNFETGGFSIDPYTLTYFCRRHGHREERRGASAPLRPPLLLGAVDGSFRAPWKYRFLSLSFFFWAKRMFYSTDCKGSLAVPNGHHGTAQHRHAQAGRWREIVCLGPIAIWGNVRNPPLHPAECVPEQLLALPAKDSLCLHHKDQREPVVSASRVFVVCLFFKLLMSANHRATIVPLLFTACSYIFLGHFVQHLWKPARNNGGRWGMKYKLTDFFF